MDVIKLLRSHNGVARSQVLLREGISRYQLAGEITAGRLVRPRNGWVALPGADPMLIFAARHGVVLSCVTQAKRLGLWVLQYDALHVAVRHRSATPRLPSGVVHWSRPLQPRDPAKLTDPLINVLDCVARCQPFEPALAILDSALNKRLVDLRRLSQVPFGPAARKLLTHASPYADSGLESLARNRLTRLGFRVTEQALLYGHRVDLLVERFLVIQIDGGHHVGPQRTADIRHDAVLLAHGYQVIRLSYTQVVHNWPDAQQLIMDAVARGLP